MSRASAGLADGVAGAIAPGDMRSRWCRYAAKAIAPPAATTSTAARRRCDRLGGAWVAWTKSDLGSGIFDAVGVRSTRGAWDGFASDARSGATSTGAASAWASSRRSCSNAASTCSPPAGSGAETPGPCCKSARASGGPGDLGGRSTRLHCQQCVSLRLLIAPQAPQGERCSGEPHSLQNFAAEGFRWLQKGQTGGASIRQPAPTEATDERLYNTVARNSVYRLHVVVRRHPGRELGLATATPPCDPCPGSIRRWKGAGK
jgi:hypothetical protein